VTSLISGGALRRSFTTNAAWLLMLTVITWIVYGVVGQGFLSSFNIFTLSQIAAQYVVIGFAQLALIVLGRMNLAVGAVGVVSAMVAATVFGTLALSPVAGILAALVVGAVVGVIMGWLEQRTGLSSFIVTLASASILTGAVLIVSGGVSISTLPSSIVDFGARSLGTPYLSLQILPAILVTVVLWYLYQRTTFGYKSLAVGANEKAAALSGIRVNRIVIVGFAISGVLSGVAALMEVSRVAAALPTLGTDWLLTAFIVPVLGGNSLKGGNISIVGTVIAAVFLASINSGLVSLNVPSYWQQFALAIVLLVAVLLDSLRRRKRTAAPLASTVASHPKEEIREVL
jgi:ribose transport system permease protein